MSESGEYTLSGVKSKIGSSTARALAAREAMRASVDNALDASFSFGWEAGSLDKHEQFLQIIAVEMDEWGSGTLGRTVLERLVVILNSAKED